jgi:hypothetical protein
MDYTTKSWNLYSRLTGASLCNPWCGRTLERNLEGRSALCDKREALCRCVHTCSKNREKENVGNPD